MSVLYILLLGLYPLGLIYLIDRHFHNIDIKTQNYNLDLNLVINKSYVYVVVYLLIVIPIIVVYLYFSLNVMRNMWGISFFVLKGIDILLTGLVVIFCGSQRMILNRDIKRLI